MERGQIYGRLTIISKFPNRMRPKWFCKCTCGETTIVSASHLRTGHTRSCGCLSTKNAKGELGFNVLFASYRNKARYEDILFTITKEQFRYLTSQTCFYCKLPPRQISTGGKTAKTKEYGKYLYNGLDKVNPSLGYKFENVVPCCKQCNIAKHNYSIGDFYTWIWKVAAVIGEHHGMV